MQARCNAVAEPAANTRQQGKAVLGKEEQVSILHATAEQEAKKKI